MRRRLLPYGILFCLPAVVAGLCWLVASTRTPFKVETNDRDALAEEVQTAKPALDYETRKQRLRSLINGNHAFSMDEIKSLDGFSSSAVAIYLEFVDDQAERPTVVANSLTILSAIATDPLPLRERAVARLASSDPSIRESALELLRHVGRQDDCTPVVVLLSDPENNVAIAAARTIEFIGGKREVAALNTWLSVVDLAKDNPAAFNDRKASIANSRDELMKRLTGGVNGS